MNCLEGGCHCGNVTYVFETTAELEALGLRACMCTFCRRHGARNTSDPNGSMRIRVRDASRLNRYSFGLRTADFLLCRECGSYIGAMLEDGGARWMTVNVNTLLTPPGLDAPIVPNVFDAEDTATRIARRKTKWTPVVEFET
jgi:hypothetical protein